MKESCDEGVAGHIGPESCDGDSNGATEALTGERAGRVWSSEDPRVQGADPGPLFHPSLERRWGGRGLTKIFRPAPVDHPIAFAPLLDWSSCSPRLE